LPSIPLRLARPLSSHRRFSHEKAQKSHKEICLIVIEPSFLFMCFLCLFVTGFLTETKLWANEMGIDFPMLDQYQALA